MKTDNGESLYRCEWNYIKPEQEDHTLDWFTDARNYDEGDRRRLARLKVGGFLNLSARIGDKELRHIVTRVK